MHTIYSDQVIQSNYQIMDTKQIDNKNTSLLISCLLTVCFLFSFQASAQPSQVDSDEVLKLIDGKTFWFYPKIGSSFYCSKAEFFENGKKLAFDYKNDLKFQFSFSDSQLKVKINDYIDASTNLKSLEKNMFTYANDEQYIAVCFSDLEPTQHIVKVDQIQTKKEQEILKNRKGGVRIGMSAKHVREKTDWGEPNYINATITAKGKREQWVYGDGDYLYFTNGILTAIQMRK